eukprot:8846350-Pyramimonas_sp.AAC.1
MDECTFRAQFRFNEAAVALRRHGPRVYSTWNANHQRRSPTLWIFPDGPRVSCAIRLSLDGLLRGCGVQPSCVPV